MKTLLISLVICGSVSAQVKPADFSLGIDFGNTRSGIFENGTEKKRKIGMMAEYSLNDAVSLEGYYSFEANDYYAFNFAIGNAAGGAWGANFDHYYSTTYLGARVYPLDQYSSRSRELRGKPNYGFYMSLGYRMDQYKRNEYLITVMSQPQTDDEGNVYVDANGVVLMEVVTDRFDRFGYTLNWRGLNFGGGWKMYHSKWISSDLGFYSSAFISNPSIKDYYSINGSRRIIPELIWEDMVDGIQAGAKNGRGLELRITVAVNLDIKI